MIRVSYIELYNEEIQDLLSDDQSPEYMSRLKIAEDPKTGPYIRNCVDTVAASSDQIYELLKVCQLSDP